MKKKAISPLIATVLIIGFTVALAAVIMTWGQSFIKGMQERTAESTEAQLVCAQDVKIDVQDACIICTDTTPADGICDTGVAGTGAKVTTANDGSVKVVSYKIRLYVSSSTVGTVDADGNAGAGIEAFGIWTDSIPADTGDPSPTVVYENLKAAGVVPTIELNGVPVTCTASTDMFGSPTGSVLKAC